MSATPHTPPLAGVLGWPISHSLSPVIHSTWAQREGLSAYYIPIAVKDDDHSFQTAVDGLRTLGFAGVNVTLPHKERALRISDRQSEAALNAGAANMLSFADGEIRADNSDIVGFVNGLSELTDNKDDRTKAVVLGAGGAARGVVLALQSAGFSSIDLLNRTRAKADRLSVDTGVTARNWDERNAILSDCDLLVNTTSLGMSGQPPLDISLSGLPAAAIVSDIVYTPLKTGLLHQAEERGLRTMDGLSMLMHQAVPGYKAWLGQRADVDADLRERLTAILQERTAT